MGLERGSAVFAQVAVTEREHLRAAMGGWAPSGPSERHRILGSDAPPACMAGQVLSLLGDYSMIG